MSTQSAFLDEIRRALPRSGGVRGLLLLPALAMLGTLIPGRLGTAFFDPIYHAFYTALAVLFAGSFAAQGFGGERERQFLMNWTGALPPVVLGKMLAAALWGWLCWLLIYGASLAAMGAAAMGSQALPVWTLLGAAVLAAGGAFASAAAGGMLGLSTMSAMTARQLLRLGFFFILLLLVIGPRLLPSDIQAALRGLLAWHAAGHTMIVAGALCMLFGLMLYRRALSLLGEQRTGLSITA